MTRSKLARFKGRVRMRAAALAFVVATTVAFAIPFVSMCWSDATTGGNNPPHVVDSARRPPRPPFIVLCSRELEHVTRGGAGIVVADVARALVLAGWRVTVVLHAPVETRKMVKGWVSAAANAWGGGSTALHARILSLTSIILLEDLVHQQPQPADTDSAESFGDLTPLALWRESAMWERGIAHLYASEPFDAVEFFDYGAPAYCFLQKRVRCILAGRRDCDGPLVWIRTHGLLQSIQSVESPDSRAPSSSMSERAAASNEHAGNSRIAYVYRMETRALQLADGVIANSASIGRDYARLHGLDTRGDRVIPVPPTLASLVAQLKPLLTTRKHARPHARQNVLIYGKLQKVKGADMAARAMTQVMRALDEEGSAWNGSIIFVGEDMPCDREPGLSMSTSIIRKIPVELRERFIFLGRLTRGDIGYVAAAHDIRFAILPSRYETFCLAAHELKHFNVPLVLPDLPAYRDFFVDRENALFFKAGSATDLARVAARALLDDTAIEDLSSAPPLIYSDPVKAYSLLLSR